MMATYRLNYSARFILYAIALPVTAGLYLVQTTYASFASPIEWATLDTTVLIIFLMILDPVVRAWNAPSMEVDFNTTDMLDKVTRFNFFVTNTGRKPATDVRVEFRILPFPKIDAEHPENNDTIPSRPAFLIADDMTLPALVFRDQWLGPRLGFDIFYDSKSDELRINWLKEIRDGSDIRPSVEERGPVKCVGAMFHIVVGWNFMGSGELVTYPYQFEKKGKKRSPEITKRSRF